MKNPRGVCSIGGLVGMSIRSRKKDLGPMLKGDKLSLIGWDNLLDS